MTSDVDDQIGEGEDYVGRGLILRDFDRFCAPVKCSGFVRFDVSLKIHGPMLPLASKFLPG